MREFELISLNGKLGTIQCESFEEAELFLAMNFPNEYFGANIKEIGKNNAMCIAVKEAFDEDDTPIKIAMRNLDAKIKIKNDLCDISHDREGVIKVPYKNLSSEYGMFFKDIQKQKCS